MSDTTPALGIRSVTVTDKDGVTVPANLAYCPHCPAHNNDRFFAYMIGDHLHLQCVRCGTSFCDGSCSMTEVHLTR